MLTIYKYLTGINTREGKELLSMKQAGISGSNGIKLRNGKLRQNLRQILLTMNSNSLWKTHQHMCNREQSCTDKKGDLNDLLGLSNLKHL